MKKIRYIFPILFAAALLLAAFALAACGDKSDIVELRVENPKISFMCGDAFTAGDDFKVYAEYRDGRTEEVTDYTIRQEHGMDMSVAGDYQITVSFGGKRVIYTVYVNDSPDVLRKIELDTARVKKQYRLGDELALDGLALDLTYENAQKVTFPVRTTSLADFDVSVVGEDGTVIKNVFTALGKFTVTVSRGNVKASFDLTVDSVNISTVQSALTVGGYFARDIVSGNMLVKGARMLVPEGSTLKPGEPYTSEIYEYTFGKNYTLIKEVSNTPAAEYHCGTDDEGFFVTYAENGVIKNSNRNNPSMMSGAPVLLWYSNSTEYGAENALNNLYGHALRCSNKDLKETVDESAKTFAFSFSGLEQREGSSDYYETSVEFKLGDGYEISEVSITQDYYENNSTLAGQDGYKPTFVTDASGKTSPNGDYSYRTIISITQTTGERTAENKYSRNMFTVTSYKLVYDGKTLQDNAVLDCTAGNIYRLKITDVLPETAQLSIDAVLFDYEGNHGRVESFVSNEHFVLMHSGDEITVSTKHGGSWIIYIMTEKTKKTIVINVEGDAPEADMLPKLLNNDSGKFYDGSDKTVVVGDAVYFYGAVEQYANSAQTATVTSDNAADASIVAAKADGIDCWKFTADKAGTYQVTVVSDVAERVRCIFNFTVTEIDIASLLSGTYKVQDRVGDIYTVTFASFDKDSGTGTVSVTRTPTDEDNVPIEDRAVSQTFSFTAEGTSIAVPHNTGTDKIWVEFAVDENNDLVLIDQRGARYVLRREQTA